MNYEDSISEKRFIPNIVILFKGFYWAIRQPDSGLTIDTNRLSVEQVTINPTKIDPYQANTTINTYTFKLVDKEYAVTVLFDGITKFFQNEQVSIWIGRCGVDMDFADYMKLPDTFVKSVSKDGNTYSFKTTEAKDRLNRPAFNTRNKLQVDILAATDEIDMENTIDTAIYPAAGLIKIEDEFISYASIDTVNNRFAGCIRGEKNSVPVDHEQGATVYLVTEVTENPIDIILQCLISQGGGGTYDVLNDGAGIDESMINVAKLEEIRDEFFVSQSYNLLLYGIDNILKFLEKEILFPNELRIIADNTSKLSLAVLNRRVFDDLTPVIDESTIKKQPAYDVDDSDIINVINIEYDYAEGTGKFRKLYTLEDAASIADFGRRDAKELALKGVKESLGGATIVANIAQRFLGRFAYPKPTISFSTHLDKSLVQLGDKAEIVTSTLPTDTGDLNFGETLEVIERGINWKTGDVKFKVAFTSFTGIRECYLAPSDAFTVIADNQLEVGAGRGALYRPGWKMKVYNDVTRDYLTEQVNEISSIVGDVLHFVDDWILIVNTHLLWEDGLLLQEDGDRIIQQEDSALGDQLRIMFCDYDDATNTQKRYCFVGINNLPFIDGRKNYQITL